MVITVLIFFIPLAFLFPGLRHGLYASHILILMALSWWKFPAFSYPLFHEYYPYFLGLVHFISINAITFLAYGWDKKKAIKGSWRIPEKTLHALTMIGGTIGAWAGSRTFRHKTIKKQFRQMFWLITGGQIALLITLAWLS